MRTNDTIAAIATALSPSGIGIVRISGEDAITIADKIFKGKNKLCDVNTHTINFGYVIKGEETIDQVLCMVMKAPHSYTGEDVVEVQCHGGVLVMEKILSAAIDAGANMAEPGEFTKRAFLNGKMDLSQAEAVADIINADNQNSLKVGVKQLKGNLSKDISDMRASILHEIAFIEAALDDPEHYSLEGYGEELKSKMIPIKEGLERLISNSDAGIIMKSGINTVILGKPNAGKSSIYNLLAGSEKAIVTDIAGTTRDTLTENITLGGIKLNITDTAGVRESADQVEKIGVLRAKSAANDAELIICVVEIGSKLSDEDREILDFTKGKRRIVLLNKQDIFGGNLDEIVKETQDLVGSDTPVLVFSAKTASGLGDLAGVIKKMFFSGDINLNDETYVTSVRHLQELKAALTSINLVLDGIELNQTEDLISVDLTDAYESLGHITGEAIGEDIINEIFAKFCMGK